MPKRELPRPLTPQAPRGGTARRAGERAALGLLLAMAVAALGSLACASQRPAAEPVATSPGDRGAPPPGPAAEVPAAPAATPSPPLSVRYAYTAISGSMSLLWVANDLGLFAKHGIQPELQYVPSIQTIQAVLAGEADFGLMSGRTPIEARLAGGDPTIVAVFSNKVLQSLFAAPAVPSVADLRGKRVGITRFGTVVDNSARTLLRTGGLTPPDDVALIQLTGLPEILAGLQAGVVDAGVLSPPTTLAARKAGYRELARMQDLPFDYPFIALVARQSYVEANAEAVRRTLRAMAEAARTFKEQRESVLPVLAAYLRTDDPEVLAETYQVNAEVIDLSLQPSAAGLQALFDEVAADKPETRQLSAADVFDARWTDGLAREGAAR